MSGLLRAVADVWAVRRREELLRLKAVINCHSPKFLIMCVLCKHQAPEGLRLKQL